jgi:hypothetical protein
LALNKLFDQSCRLKIPDQRRPASDVPQHSEGFDCRGKVNSALREALNLTRECAAFSENLRDFYDFTGKSVLLVGAGTQTLLSPAPRIKKLIAIDPGGPVGDSKGTLFQISGHDVLEVIPAKFESVFLFVDVVYFEFSLHAIADPKMALTHARGMAPDIVVFEHSPNSEWTFQTGEAQMVRRSSLAMKRFGICRRKTFQVEQQFADYHEFFAKISAQGPIATQRANPYLGVNNIVIPMRFQLVLL